jgi:hypothetical protein
VGTYEYGHFDHSSHNSSAGRKQKPRKVVKKEQSGGKARTAGTLEPSIVHKRVPFATASAFARVRIKRWQLHFCSPSADVGLSHGVWGGQVPAQDVAVDCQVRAVRPRVSRRLAHRRIQQHRAAAAAAGARAHLHQN